MLEHILGEVLDAKRTSLCRRGAVPLEIEGVHAESSSELLGQSRELRARAKRAV
jgi:hypothetical protein